MNNLWYALLSLDYTLSEKWMFFRCWFNDFFVSYADQPERNPSSLLHLAARSGDIKLIKKVLDNEKISVDLQDEHGWTALHIATRENNVEMVEYLVNEFGAKIDIQSFESSLTPSQIAVSDSNLELTIFYISQGGKFNSNSLSGQYGGHGMRKKYLEELCIQLTKGYKNQEALQDIKKAMEAHNLFIEEKIEEYKSLISPFIPDDREDLKLIDLEPINLKLTNLDNSSFLGDNNQ